MWIPYTDTIVVVVSDVAKAGAKAAQTLPEEERVEPLKKLFLGNETCTPPKFNMDPENEPLEEEISFGNHLFRPLIFGGAISGVRQKHPKVKGKNMWPVKRLFLEFSPRRLGKMFIHF